jgi:hypothetical protein
VGQRLCHLEVPIQIGIVRLKKLQVSGQAALFFHAFDRLMSNSATLFSDHDLLPLLKNRYMRF